MSEPTWALIAGGGTAGHILPGLSIASALVDRGEPLDRLLWIGSERGQESTLVPPSGIELIVLPGRGIQRRLTPANVGAVFGLVVAAVERVAGLHHDQRAAAPVVLRVDRAARGPAC